MAGRWAGRPGKETKPRRKDLVVFSALSLHTRENTV